MATDSENLLAGRADFEAIAQWVRPGAQVLDLGCGDGLCCAFSKKSAARPVTASRSTTPSC
jgi:cyclopropane fatty-acyl-phospholipid synthase-like methyltransferase